MTEREKEILKRKAAKNGITVSEYAQKLLANSDDETIRVIDTEPLRMAAHELAKQGTNLNQFMRFLNSNGAPKHTAVRVELPEKAEKTYAGSDWKEKMASLVSDLNVCSVNNCVD